MITIKEYATRKGVSHQSIYKMIQTHLEELEPHIVQRGRTRYLTDAAVEIMEQYRETSPQVIESYNDAARIKELEDQIKRLLSEKSVLQEKLTAVSEWKAEKAEQLAEMKYKDLLLEDKSKKLDELDQQYHSEKERADKLHLELQQEVNRPLTWKERLTGRKESK